MKLFDTHQHVIYTGKFGYRWTAGIDALAGRDFTVRDYERLAPPEVAGTLFMETAVDDDCYRDEARFCAGLARDPGNRMAGVIASCRPEESAGFDEWLAECAALGVAGFRRVLHVVSDEVSASDSFRANVRRIGAAGKTFDACFAARQLRLAAELAGACDNTLIILDHLGAPDIAGGTLDPWRADMARLAALPNVVCKLSGIMAYARPQDMTLAGIAPWVDHALTTFGTERMVWGSDWPVVEVARGLNAWIEVTRAIFARLSQDEADAIGYRNARKFYALG